MLFRNAMRLSRHIVLLSSGLSYYVISQTTSKSCLRSGQVFVVLPHASCSFSVCCFPRAPRVSFYSVSFSFSFCAFPFLFPPFSFSSQQGYDRSLGAAEGFKLLCFVSNILNRNPADSILLLKDVN